MSSSTPSSRPDERQPSREELLFTLDICRRALPLHAHAAHFAWFDYLAELVQQVARATCCTSSPSAQLERRCWPK